MTFAEMLNLCYGDLGYGPTTVPTAVVTRFKSWLNQGHYHLHRDPRMSDLRMGTLTFSSVANQAVYAFPQAFERIDAIVQEPNARRLVMRTRDWFRSFDPGETVSGLPDSYIPEGWQCVLVQPASTGLWAVSDSASDTTQIVRLRGVRANGDQAAEASATLTGLTRVALGSITDYVRVQGWDVSAVGVGTISLYNAASSGTVVARLPIGMTSVQYQATRLWPTPGDVYVFTVDGQLELYPLVNDNDIPMLPPSFHDLLPCYGRMKEYERTQDKRLGVAQSEWANGLNQLVAFVQFPNSWRPIAGSGSLYGRTWPNLAGGWWPSDA